MRATLLRSVLFLGTLGAMAAAPTFGQTTNPDYRLMVMRYMTAPPIEGVLTQNDVPVRIESVKAPDTLVAGEEGAFILQANIETASLPLRAIWEFGDGNTAHGLVARHAYGEAGQFEVRVTLENQAGQTSRRHRITVLEPARP